MIYLGTLHWSFSILSNLNYSFLLQWWQFLIPQAEAGEFKMTEPHGTDPSQIIPADSYQCPYTPNRCIHARLLPSTGDCLRMFSCHLRGAFSRVSEHWKDAVGFTEVGVVGKREVLRQFMVHGDDNWVRWSLGGKDGWVSA